MCVLRSAEKAARPPCNRLSCFGLPLCGSLKPLSHFRVLPRGATNPNLAPPSSFHLRRPRIHDVQASHHRRARCCLVRVSFARADFASSFMSYFNCMGDLLLSLQLPLAIRDSICTSEGAPNLPIIRTGLPRRLLAPRSSSAVASARRAPSCRAPARPSSSPRLAVAASCRQLVLRRLTSSLCSTSSDGTLATTTTP